MLCGSQTTKLAPKNPGTLKLDPITAAEVEQAAVARGNAAFGVPGLVADAALDFDGEPIVRIKVPAVFATPTAEERAAHETLRQAPYRSWSQWCIAARTADESRKTCCDK